jgi:hypothetical protein
MLTNYESVIGGNAIVHHQLVEQIGAFEVLPIAINCFVPI